MEEELISIIVPVYNVEKYVGKCIESILEQNYKNFELILIDDGSKDRSGEICDEYAKKYEKIIVIHKQNEGLSKTRNKGLEIAKGKYISFIDSDDYVEKDFLETLYKLIKENNASIAQCGYNIIGEEKKEDNSVYIYTGKQMISDIYTSLWITNTVVWNKLYEAEILKKYKFKEDKIHEDEFFTWKLFYEVDKVPVTTKQLYNYRKVQDSITNKKYTIERLSYIEALEERLQCFKNNNDIQLYEETLGGYVEALLDNYIKCKNNIQDSKEIQKELIHKFKANWKKTMHSKYISYKKKAFILIAVISKKGYELLMKTLIKIYQDNK